MLIRNQVNNSDNFQVLSDTFQVIDKISVRVTQLIKSAIISLKKLDWRVVVPNKEDPVCYIAL